ncbi:MAG: glycosyltransferase [Olleya sp.]
MKYYFIATNYNNPHHTVNYLNSVFNLPCPKGVTKHVIIVDNDSNEPLDSISKTINSLKKNNFSAELIKNSNNSGYFKGLNIGIDAINNEEKFVAIIGNNDLIFDEDFITKIDILDFAEDDYCIAPNVYLPNGKKQNPHQLKKPSKQAIKRLKLYYKNYYFGRIMIKLNSWLKKSKKEIEYTTPIYIHGGIGAIYILTPQFFKKNKRLNAPVFLYGEEVLISHQIHTTGGKMLYHPDVKVMHNEHSSVSKLGNKNLHKIGKESFEIFKEYY